MKKAWVLSYPLSAQRRLWSDWADAQADLSLRWVHSHIVGFFMSRLISSSCNYERKKSVFKECRLTRTEKGMHCLWQGLYCDISVPFLLGFESAMCRLIVLVPDHCLFIFTPNIKCQWMLHQLYNWAASWWNQQNDCAPSEDSDQPGHPPSLIRAFAVRSMGS